MALPITLIAKIANAITWFKESKVGQLPIPGASQNVGEMTASKTGVVAMTIVTFSINHITANPDSYVGWVMLGVCLLAVTIGDRIDKIYKLLAKKEEMAEEG